MRHTHTYQSSIVRQIIPKPCRDKIGHLLWYHARELIGISKPREFFMETFELNLPNSALTKYDALNHVFRSLGYTVTAVPSGVAGKLKWEMRL